MVIAGFDAASVSPNDVSLELMAILLHPIKIIIRKNNGATQSSISLDETLMTERACAFFVENNDRETQLDSSTCHTYKKTSVKINFHSCYGENTRLSSSESRALTNTRKKRDVTDTPRTSQRSGLIRITTCVVNAQERKGSHL